MTEEYARDLTTSSHASSRMVHFLLELASVSSSACSLLPARARAHFFDSLKSCLVIRNSEVNDRALNAEAC